MQQFKLEKGHYIRALCLIGLDDIVVEAGGDLSAAMNEVGLDPASLSNVDQLISFRAFSALLEKCAKDFDLPDLGLMWSMRMRPTYPNTGPLLALAHFNANGRGWLNEIQSYWSYHTNAFSFKVFEDVAPGISAFREQNSYLGLKSRQLSENFIANVVAIAQLGLGRPNEFADRICFSHGRPKDTSKHEALFQCPVEFGCDNDEVLFRSQIFDYKTGGKLTPLRPLVRRYVQSRIDRLEFYDVGIATNVGLTIASLIGTGRTDLASIANAMEVSPKKLQRLLTSEGTNFSEVAENTREKLAQEMMAQPSPPVAQVANFLGYSGNAPFTQAFRKWTGLSPLQWRKSRK
jgi:AraC-like DNA-binding protein